MFFVYFKIYQAFAKHRARQIYRQKLAVSSRVIRRHIESTILHEISHILPTSDEFAKDADEDEDDEEEVVDRPPYFEDEECVCRNLNENDTRRAHSTTAAPVLPLQHSIIYEEEEDVSIEDSPEKSEKSDKSADSSNNEEPVRKEKECSNIKESSSPSNAILSRVNGQTKTGSPQTPKVTFKHPNDIPEDEEDAPVTPTTAKRKMLLQSKKQWKSFGYVENSIGKQSSIEEEDSSSQTKISPTQKQPNNIIKALIKKRNSEGTTEDLNNPLKIQQMILKNKNGRIGGNSTAMPTYEKVRRHKRRKELNLRKSLQTRPRTISAAKERRGVRVLGIILGCFTLCWTPFFVMYVFVQFCAYCSVNPHIEMFITWLGYSNSAMNPIIYTVFNRDYQVALKRIFLGRRSGGGSSGIRSTLQRPICPIR
uniref:G-protein coupled receptors family 1 profile domain-containing protein n=1 Tax=Meloidogyne incognita TaxID=6306 RepID=A0A914LI32_MELIC